MTHASGSARKRPRAGRQGQVGHRQHPLFDQGHQPVRAQMRREIPQRTIVAAVSDWLLALLASLKIMNGELPVRVIPFDSQVDIVRRLCVAFGYPLWEPAELLARCDQIGETMAPRDGTWT
jgi:hypothetical protein